MYVAELKRVYQIPPTTWLPLPVSKHIKVAMSKEKGLRYGHEADELAMQRVKGEVEQVMVSKVSVDIDTIFDEGTFGDWQFDGIFRNTHWPLVILVEGAFGSGKTTLAYHYCQKWANGKLAMFDLVALVYLRHPAVHSAGVSMSLNELLLVASGNDDERDIVANVAQCIKDGLKFLLILDGWDEAPAWLRARSLSSFQHDDSFFGKLLRSLSSKTTILITSRPDSSVDLQRLTYVNRVEILGFTKESIHDYFQEALSTQFSSDKVTIECRKLKEHLIKYPAIESSCYIPLNAAILTLVYLVRNCTLPTTRYELLCELLLCCIDREVNTRQPYRAYESISSLDDLPDDLREHLSNISELAYEGIVQNKVVFSQKEIHQDIPAMGVLQKVQWAGIRSKTMSYSFSHLSIQELLAAYYISKMKETDQVKVFQTLLDEPRFSSVLQFYAGFTNLTNEGVREIITTRQFDGIKHPNHALISFIRCFFEAQVMSDLLYQQIVSRLNGKLYLSHITLSPLDCMSVGYFLAFALRHIKLSVRLRMCHLNDHLFDLVVKEFSKHSRAKDTLHGVKILIMSHNKFCGAHIATVLQKNTTIRLLDISCCSISDEGAESLARALTVNTSLQELNISVNKIGNNGSAHLFTALQTNTTVRKLHISHCRISDEGAEVLARSLAVISLQELDISINNISDNGIAHIATALQTNCTLKTLAVSVTDEGVELLARAIDSLENLELYWSTTHPDTTMKKLGECISTNNVLKQLKMEITIDDSSMCQSDDDFQQLVSIGGKQLIHYLESNRLKTLEVRLHYNSDFHQVFNEAAARVNSARNKENRLSVILKSLFVSFQPIY